MFTCIILDYYDFLFYKGKSNIPYIITHVLEKQPVIYTILSNR